MEIDLDKLQKSIIYLERMTEGKNPVNNMPAEEDAVINNPNVIRCMFFVKEVLEEVQRNGGLVGKKGSAKGWESFPVSHISKFQYEKDKSISHLVSQINEGLDTERYKKLTVRMVQNWLMDNGYLELIHNDNNNTNKRVPTEKGKELGMRTELTTSFQGISYIAVIYNEKAQKFIVDHMEDIVSSK